MSPSLRSLSVAILLTRLTLSAGSQPLEPWPIENPVPAPPQPAPVIQPLPPGPEQGMAALARSQNSNRYLFLFFLAEHSEQTRALWSVFQSAALKGLPYGDALAIQIHDPNEQGIVKRFEVSRAPMPLVIVMAPNGAVMGGLTAPFSENQILGAIGTPAMEKALYALQSQKLVFLCFQNGATQGNEAALYGVNEVKADPQFNPFTEVIPVDPKDPRETKFLAQLEIDPEAVAAQTVMMAPPGAVLGKFMGGTTKTMLLSKIQASGACGPGGVCGPGGCGPAASKSKGPTTSVPQKKGFVAKVKSLFSD